MSPIIRKFPYIPALLLTGITAQLALYGLGPWGVLALVVALLWFGFELVRWLLPVIRPEAPTSAAPDLIGDAPHSAPVSLVYFLSEPRQADEAAIRSCVSSALGIRFHTGVADPDSYVTRFSPAPPSEAGPGIQHFMVRVPAGLFAVLVSDRPFIENPEEFAKRSIRDKRLRNAVSRHVAWVSVDLMDGAESDDAYRTIGKILAAMAGPDCLAVYSPQLQRCNEFDPGLIEDLRSANPLGLFDEPTFEPVIEISDNDPRMAAAVREALRRWPEFVAAYERSSSAERERFIVKAEFREGKKSEFMWISVQEIGLDTISGILMNDPHELLECHRGALVSIPVSQLNDWIYPGLGGSHIGGFTLDVLAEDEDWQ